MTPISQVLLRQPTRPAHGGYPGEVVVQDEYLQCVEPECGWSYPLDQGDDECLQCHGELEVRRAYPVESTIRMALS